MERRPRVSVALARVLTAVADGAARRGRLRPEPPGADGGAVRAGLGAGLAGPAPGHAAPVGAAQTLRAHAVCPPRALGRPARPAEELAAVAACRGVGCRGAKRKRRPSAFQRWLDPALGGLT